MDAWYQKLADRYGEEFCRIAGYFDETKPFTVPYGEVFDLPRGKIVYQFSGAFYPFHEGHLDTITNAILFTHQRFDSDLIFIVIHADHSEYRHSKGTYDEEKFIRSFDIMDKLFKGRWMLVLEDKMPDGCSRNFTRLYNELFNQNYAVTFVSGGDRANFCLTFLDEGRCIISGRDQAAMYQKYRYLHDFVRNRILFAEGNNPQSSTAIRSQS